MIRLTNSELLTGASVGCMRLVQALTKKWNSSHGAGGIDPWISNIEGAQGELAVAKALGIYWQPIVGDPDADDAGPYQVRTNCSRRWDDTPLHPGDRDDRVFIGVLSFMPDFDIMGWIWGRDGKRQEWWRDGTPGRPAFWVPRGKLLPMSELPTVEQLMLMRGAA